LPGDSGSMAFAMNIHGQAVGYSSGPRGEHAVVWGADDNPSLLPGTPGGSSRATAATPGATWSARPTRRPGCEPFAGPAAALLRAWGRFPDMSPARPSAVNARGATPSAIRRTSTRSVVPLCGPRAAGIFRPGDPAWRRLQSGAGEQRRR
jgi:hypothetical protein